MTGDRETGSLGEWLRSSFGAAQESCAGGGESSSARIPLPTHFGAPGGEHPGLYPFTRGISTRGYLDQPWVMGMYSGYASPRETNARFKALLATGQTGLSIALDLPTQIGVD